MGEKAKSRMPHAASQGEKVKLVGASKKQAQKAKQPAEIGGRDGPEPTRFGDWEKNGRCIDF